jgi:hypothetical protein
MDLREKVAELVELKNQLKSLADDEKAIKAEIEALENDIELDMLNSGSSKHTFPGVATISMSIQNFPRVADEDRFFEYLRKTDQDGLIKETVNANTLKAWFKEQEFESDEEINQIGLSNYKKPKLNVRSL